MRRRPATSQPTQSSNSRDHHLVSTCRAVTSNRRVDGADAEHERVVAAVAAAERAHRVSREQSRARKTFISSSLEAAAGLKPVDAKQQPLRSPSPRHRAPSRHLKPRTNSAHAERKRVVAVVAAESALRAR